MQPALIIAVLAALAASVAAWLWGPPWWAAWRRHRVLQQPFPHAWRRVLRRHMPLYARLPPQLQQQLRRQVQLLLSRVPLIGCAGLVVTDTVRVLIAAQAALLLLNRGPAADFRGLRQVLVYPDAFVVDRVQRDGLGLESADRRVLAGESWQSRQVIVSWADVLAGAADPDDGRNVVIHEFAHQLDQDHGTANGAPFLPGGHVRWAAVMTAAYAALQDRIARGEPGLIDAYGGTDPAEFFAVASEVFFERGAELAAEQPALYAELARCYRVDPAAW